METDVFKTGCILLSAYIFSWRNRSFPQSTEKHYLPRRLRAVDDEILKEQLSSLYVAGILVPDTSQLTAGEIKWRFSYAVISAMVERSFLWPEESADDAAFQIIQTLSESLTPRQ